MRRAVACSSLWLLTCTGVPAVDHEQPVEVVAAPPPIPDPPASPAAPPPAPTGADEIEGAPPDVPEDMSGSPSHVTRPEQLPCTRWPSVATLCDCLERHHRRSLGAEQTWCRR